MRGSRDQIARFQSDFYRDQYRKILRWLMGSIVIIFLLLITIIYFVLREPARQYFANTSDGRILSMPNVKR